MSKVMRQLKSSERSRRSSGMPEPMLAPVMTPQPQPKGIVRYLSIALVPPMVIAGLVVIYTYQSEKHAWLESNVSETVSIEVPFEYQIEKAPDFGPLAATYSQRDDRVSNVTEGEMDDDALPDEIPGKAGHTVQNVSPDETDLLTGLDLSGLSPELAQRFASAVNTIPQVESENSDDQVSNLSQQPDSWYGKLPAMNFQTHVYSSRADKRWVKVNGVEYSEGDWISADVELVAIEQQACRIRYKGELIEVPALYDWKG